MHPREEGIRAVPVRTTKIHLAIVTGSQDDLGTYFARP